MIPANATKVSAVRVDKSGIHVSFVGTKQGIGFSSLEHLQSEIEWCKERLPYCLFMAEVERHLASDARLENARALEQVEFVNP